MRLWLPQLFTMVSDFEVVKLSGLNDGLDTNLCSMIASSVNQSIANTESIHYTGECTQVVSAY